ncbi:Taz1-interactin-like proteing factor 1 [Venustampulla echinocandica]|uniref:Autophagy-related protein 11 n=1 Tax=Venustampulla echinocandica TaxID=2656787 RepID=A0A370U3C1_9HELO|nr:Taz1-interactin-like proteing factor 1 [Venustampulla echinocandica]RDL42262.1 Taz1-interactin-like proteing factor 1 [Venustampulla echinocandica]
MPLQILLAHTGQRLHTDPGTFASLDAFKTWVAGHSSISPQDHIALTTQGKPVRFQALSVEKEIFVYDRRIVQPLSPTSAKAFQSEIPLPPKYSPGKVPDTIADQNDLQAWKDLFMTRRSWALEVVDDCAAMSQEAQERYKETEVLVRGVDAAVYNLEKHVKALDQKNADIQAWSKDIQKEQELAGTDWEASMARLRALPAATDMIKFITGRDPRRNQPSPTLEDLVDVEDVKRAGKLVRHISTQLNRNSADLGTKVDSVLGKIDGLFDKVESNPARTAFGRVAEPMQLMEDIEAIARKVSSDYETVLGYSNTAKNVSQASRSALLHTKNFLPNILKRSLEMDGLLRLATEARNAMASDSLDAMHEIASLTALVAEANAQFAALELDGDGFDAIHLLGMLNTLPVTYASFMAEAVRRREWNEKIRSDSSTLVNEMATFQDEEARRRRKWQKSTGATLWGDRIERKVMGLEVNLHGEEDEWPEVARSDLDELLETMKTHDPKSLIVTDLTKIITDLNNPTKQQSKRARAFKAGSIHEAALGRSALLVRGDDELMRVLQEEKHKVENKLKTAESRVRRLEDLLHRQSHLSQNSSRNVFQLPGYTSPDAQTSANPLASPRPNDDQSRRSSMSSRRFSANQGAEEKVFQQKLLSLETELNAEREKTAGMKKEITSQKTASDDMKAQIEAANSTKQDLLENFEAQQREFIEERRSLEEEIKRLKAKLEELEDEIDRYVGSREHEKASVDERVRSLQDELERVRKEHVAEAQKAQGQVEFLRNDSKLQRETNEALENQIQKMQEENREFQARAEEAESLAEEQRKVLHDVHSHLSPVAPVPDDLPALAEALATLPGDLIAELESVKSDATIARSDRDAAQNTIAELKSELTETKDGLAKEESVALQLREALDAEKARFAAFEEELEGERSELTSLRTRIADGETGSEALRSRLEERERKVTSLAEDLASHQSQVGSLEEELRAFQEKHQSVQTKHESLATRFEARTSRAKDLTQRVYAQNDRLCRLLERLSYSVTRDGSTMTIQRIPKPERANANDSSDPGSSLRKSISGAVTRKAMVDSGDLDLLYWMHNDDSEAESEKYEAYLNAIGSFDVEQFCELITKRIKDIEYTAKKYSRDARAYREKSHMAQKEAHEKIAYKHFKEGDLALFLPTRNQATGAWAAFNVGAPHYFLREQDSHKLRTRDWLLARIHKIEDRVVDLSKSMSGNAADRKSLGGDSFEDDNPFELSDGLRWYLIDASEEKPGAPSTPGLGKSTVASANIDATGSIRRSKKSSSGGVEGINKTLSKSLDSRRSSSNSKKAVPGASSLVKTTSTTADSSSLKAVSTTSIQPPGEASEDPQRESEQGNTNGVSEQAANPPEDPQGSQTPTGTTSHPEASATTTPPAGTSPGKKSVIWDSLWSLDLSLESGRNKK